MLTFILSPQIVNIRGMLIHFSLSFHLTSHKGATTTTQLLGMESTRSTVSISAVLLRLILSARNASPQPSTH